MKHFIILGYAQIYYLYRRLAMLSFKSMPILYVLGSDAFKVFTAKALCYARFINAKKKVPGYKEFLATKNFDKPSFNFLTPNIDEIPIMDKENYVKKFSINARCLQGKLPSTNVIIDESSGSSGQATNWARGKLERKYNARMIEFGIKKTLGQKPLFIINAFALGPWATGVNVTMSCVKFSILKSLGPDKIKIENTLKDFGRGYNYVIMGYPPFLKSLVDTIDIDWARYNITFIFGGESMSEGMREYLQEKGVKKIFSSMGASDVELNFAAESDFTIALRKLLGQDEKLRRELVKYEGGLPMLFQYNPTDFYIESSADDELIISTCRPSYISPKIRYNLHDRAYTHSIKHILAVLENFGYKNKLPMPRTHLPVLFHFGRSDMTVSFYGANLGLKDIQESISAVKLLAAQCQSFCFAVKESNEEDKQFAVSIELNDGICLGTMNVDELHFDFFEALAICNQDFREARKMIADPQQLALNFFNVGTGPFSNNNKNIKASYIQ